MNIRETILNNIFLYRIASQFCKKFLFVTLITSILRGLLKLLVNVILIRFIYSSLENEATFRSFALIALGMGVGYLCFWGINSWYQDYFAPQIKYKFYDGVYIEMLNKAKNISLQNYDNPQFYDDFIWSMNESDTRIYNAVILLGDFCNTLIYVFGMISVIFMIEGLIAICIFVCVALSVCINILRVKLSYERDQSLNALNRKKQYYDRLMYLADYAKEIKTTKVDVLINKKFDETMMEHNAITLKYAKKIALLNFIMRCTTSTLFDVVLIMYMAYSVIVTQKLLVSEFAVLINVIWQIFFALNSIVNHITTFFQNGIYSKKMRTFINTKDQDEGVGHFIASPEYNSMSLQDITFSYGNRKIIDHLDLEIKAGEKVAIVGYNGAGKTTLLKLILRLYQVNGGVIQLNTVNVNEFDLTSYRSMFGVIFQDYRLFSLSIAENIARGHSIDENIITELLKKCGLDDDRFMTLDNQITKEFDNEGLVLSGGQSQKIAIARMLYQDANILILDEPSSALDPTVEEELNKLIMIENKQKTVIFISHRLSSVRLADKIVLIDNGVVEEMGTHDELLEINKKYAEMFRVQSSKYIDQNYDESC